MRALLVLLLFAAPVQVAARPKPPQLQLAFAGFQPASTDVDAAAVRIAESSVVRGLTKAGVPMLTPAQVRARLGEEAHAALLLCVSAVGVCDVPTALAPLQVVIGWISRDGRQVDSQLVVLRADGTHAATVEIRAASLQRAMFQWEREAEVLPSTLASSLRLHHEPPAHLERGVLMTAGGTAVVAGGVLALLHASQLDRRLRGLEPPTPGSQDVARAMASEGALSLNAGLVLTGAGLLALGFGGTWIARGVVPQPVPAVLLTPGGAIAVISGSLP